jgi:hypothetical protein
MRLVMMGDKEDASQTVLGQLRTILAQEEINLLPQSVSVSLATLTNMTRHARSNVEMEL